MVEMENVGTSADEQHLVNVPERNKRSDSQPSSSRIPENAQFHPDLISSVFSAALLKKRLTFRQKINHFMHSPLMQTIIVAFVIIDALVVFAQLYVDLQIEKQKYNALFARCNETDHHKAEAAEAAEVAYEHALEGLHYTSLCLLSMFFVEVVVKMVTGWHHFISSIIEVLDACIVIISFALDILLLIEDFTQAVEQIAQLLILLRLWRIARIVNGAAVAMDSKWRAKYHALEDKLRDTEKLVPPDRRISADPEKK